MEKSFSHPTLTPNLEKTLIINGIVDRGGYKKESTGTFTTHLVKERIAEFLAETQLLRDMKSKSS
ncbi:MAG: hypothetical protein JXB88_22005 [Spirochaetales bacterium]|nr:hypothetical protein [Spirochaetales bacterium]